MRARDFMVVETRGCGGGKWDAGTPVWADD